MWKRSGETVDHLLLHCPTARELWDMVLGLFGVQWVIPNSIVDMLACWLARFEWHWNIEVGKAVPHCLMWSLWQKWNAQSFEGCQWTIINLKLVFLQSLYEWMQALGSVSFSSLLDLIVFCTLRPWFCCTHSILPVYLRYKISILIKSVIYHIKRKKKIYLTWDLLYAWIYACGDT